MLLPTFAEERQVVQLLFVLLKLSGSIHSPARSIFTHCNLTQPFSLSQYSAACSPKTSSDQPLYVHESSLSSIFLPYIRHWRLQDSVETNRTCDSRRRPRNWHLRRCLVASKAVSTPAPLPKHVLTHGGCARPEGDSLRWPSLN